MSISIADLEKDLAELELLRLKLLKLHIEENEKIDRIILDGMKKIEEMFK